MLLISHINTKGQFVVACINLDSWTISTTVFPKAKNYVLTILSRYSSLGWSILSLLVLLLLLLSGIASASASSIGISALSLRGISNSIVRVRLADCPLGVNLLPPHLQYWFLRDMLKLPRVYTTFTYSEIGLVIRKRKMSFTVTKNYLRVLLTATQKTMLQFI